MAELITQIQTPKYGFKIVRTGGHFGVDFDTIHDSTNNGNHEQFQSAMLALAMFVKNAYMCDMDIHGLRFMEALEHTYDGLVLIYLGISK